MELRHLRYFVAIADAGTMSRAAVELNVVQSALSHMIGKLEAELGVQLFERSGRRIRISEPGRTFLVDARRILAEAEGAKLAVRRAALGQVGQLRIGFQAVSCGRSVVSRAFRVFGARFPDVDLRIEPGLAIDLLDRIRSEQLDGAFCYLPDGQKGVESIPVQKDEWVLALPADHDLVHADTLRLRDLTACEFIWIPRTVAPVVHDRLLAQVNMRGLYPNIVQEAFQEIMIVSLVESGMGVAFVPRSFSAATAGDVVFRDVEDLDLDQNFCFVFKRGNGSAQLSHLTSIIAERRDTDTG